MDLGLALAGLLSGFVVGLTGMGGGALMTPMLVFFFGVSPLTAVSSDLVASAVMKPVGGLVHLRRGTVNLKLVGWLCLGSVPAAFAGVGLLRLLGAKSGADDVVKTALGLALLLAAAGLVGKAYLGLLERARASGEEEPYDPHASVAVRPVPTLLVGVIGGLVVGMTSVGSGSMMIVALLLLYPTLKMGQLVGTDLVQAVPLVASAAVGHLLLGEVEFGLTTSLLVGAIPGVWLGAQASSRAPTGVIRTALTMVLVASGLKMVGVPDLTLLLVVGAIALAGPPLWMWLRLRNGLPAVSGRSPSRTGAVTSGELTDQR